MNKRVMARQKKIKEILMENKEIQMNNKKKNRETKNKRINKVARVVTVLGTVSVLLLTTLNVTF